MKRWFIPILCGLIAACAPSTPEALPTPPPAPPTLAATPPPALTLTPVDIPTVTPIPSDIPTPTATPRRFPALRFTVPLGSRSQGMVGELLITEETLFQLEVYDSRAGDFDGAGIERVTFEIFGPDGFYYFKEERTSPYCVFNGAGRCDPWRLEDDQVLWPDGTPVVAGEYSAQIVAVALTPDADGDNDGNWNFDVTIELP
jgi:hypothetical protein